MGIVKLLTFLNVKAQYYRLQISATLPVTEIWLGDDAGYFVHKAVGELDIGLMPGGYLVHFGFGTSTYLIHLDQARRFTQTELEAGPICPRPSPPDL